MSEQLQKKRPGTGGTSTDAEESVVIDLESTDAMQRALAAAAEAEAKRKRDAAKEEATPKARQRRAPCCCC